MDYLQIVFYIALLFPGCLTTRKCLPTDHESVLQPERDYYYTFHGDVVVHTADNKESRISLWCDITISHVKACQYSLHLQSCFSSNGSNTKNQTLDLLKKYSVLFSMVDGEIVEIWSNEEEPLHTLNIKRGILSAFVFKLSHTESASQEITTDIHGTCPLTSTPLVADKASVKTSRNLFMCNMTGKIGEKSLFYSNKNALNSTIECDYTINKEERRLNQINCTENHVSDTIQANIYYRMTYKSSHLQKEKPKFSFTTRRVGITFEQKQQVPEDPEDFVRVAIEMLSRFVEHASDGIGLSTISEFTDLVTWLRSSSNLTTLLKEIQENKYLKDGVLGSSSKKTYMSYFNDALIHCSSLPCIELISNLIKNGEFSPPNSMYYSWSNMHSPDPAILNHVKNICHHTNSELCWMTLGRFIQSIDLKQQNLGEVLKIINSRQDEISEKDIYKEFTHILLNSTLCTNFRIIAYNQIIQVPQENELGNIILTILKTEENIPLKSHIAKSLKTLLSDTNLKSNEKRFMKVMEELLKKENLSLNQIIHETDAKSSTKSKLAFIDVSRIIQDISKFGFKISNSKDDRFLNEFFKSNDTIFVQVIRNFGHMFEFGDQSSLKFETLATLVQEAAKDIYSQLSSTEIFSKTIQDVLKQLKIDSEPFQDHSYFGTILRNIKKLEEMYRKDKPESRTFFNRVSDFIGSAWSYLSSGEIFQLPTRMIEMHALLKHLENGVYYNATRMVRIMEDHQQVPTMMGLPLKWDTSAVLAISLKTGLKLENQPENFNLLFEGIFQSSGALTYLNEMVIDLPAITQVGVQANRSVFTSAGWKTKLYCSEERKLISFDRPSRSKNILQFLKTHRLMRNGTWYDGDVGKDESSSCTVNPLSSLLGVQFCILQSHPKLPKSSNWEWQVFLQPSDDKIESYDLEFIRPREMTPDEAIIKYSIFGRAERSEVFLISVSGDSIGEMKLQMTIPVMPHFKLCAENIKGTGNYMKVINLTLHEGYHYELVYKTEYNLEESHPDPKIIFKDVVIQKRLLSLRTPFNNYSVSLTDFGKNEVKSTKVILSFNSLNSDSKWLRGILPQSFWDTDTTAWLQIQIFWNSEINKNPQQTICMIEDPHSTTQLSAGFLHLNEGGRKYICASKTHTSSGKSLAVAHLTYDSWSAKSDDSFEVQKEIFNLTIARKSWAVGVLKERRGAKLSYEVALNTAALVLEREELCDPVASWNGGYPKIDYTEQTQVKLSVDLEMQGINSQELAAKYSSVEVQELAGLWNQLIMANLSFHYPFFHEKESVKVEGYVIASVGPTTTRFQNNFEFESSYHNLQLISHSVYRSDDDFLSLRYDSCFAHIPTDKKAFHSVNFWLSAPAEKCFEAEFNHTILSQVFDLSTIVTYKCKPNQMDLHDLRLNMLSNSSEWNMLNLSISQLVEDQTSEYTFETCNVTHPLLLINVTADWVGKQRDHRKRALFTCRHENCQSTELLIQALHNGKMAAYLIIPDGSKRKKLSLERTISSDAKIQDCKITFSNDEKRVSQGLHLKGEILNANDQIWNLKLHLDECAEIYTLLRKGIQNVLKQITIIAQDAQHPVNKMLRPNLKMTLHEYLKSFQKQGNDILRDTWRNFRVTVDSVKPFFETPIMFLLNVMSIWKSYFTAKDDSIMSVKNYLNFNNVRETICQFFKPREKVLEWEFVTSGIIKLKSFNQEIPMNDSTELNSFETQQNLTESNKIAMVINFSHVFRFDEHLLSSVLSSPDCVFLLAKDVAFTVLTAREMIHVLFPEMIISINKQNKVFINESRVPSKLPVEASNGNIRVRRDQTSIEVQSPSITINCTIQELNHICVLQLETRSNMEIFGLLGSTDHSNSKELSSPEGETAFNIQKFVNKFEVSGRTECKNFKQGFKFPSSKNSAELCSNLLLQRCHLKWNILQQFTEMCRLGFMEDALAGYSALCSYENLSNSTNFKEKLQYPERQKMEIVLFIQEHRSARFTLEGMGQLQTFLSNHFAANGFSDVLYTLVSFGGRNSHDSSVLHVKQKKWLVLRDAFENLKFDGEEGDSDIRNILKSASEIVDGDSLLTKTFILLAAKETLRKNEDTLSEVKQFLKKSGILLHTFFPCTSDSDRDTFECTSQDGEDAHSSEGLQLPKLVSCMEETIFCLFTEHSNSFFQTFAATTRRSHACSTNRNWWTRMEVCPKI